MKWQCRLEPVSVAAMWFTRPDTELHIWNTQLQKHSKKHKAGTEFRSNAFQFHLPCSITFPALLQFLAFCLLWKQDVPFVRKGSSIMSKPTLFVAILNSCGLNQSSSPFSKWNRQHRRSRLFYTTSVCFPIVWTLSLLVSFCSHYSSFLYSMSRFKVIRSHCYITPPPSPHKSVPAPVSVSRVK